MHEHQLAISWPESILVWWMDFLIVEVLCGDDSCWSLVRNFWWVLGGVWMSICFLHARLCSWKTLNLHSIRWFHGVGSWMYLVLSHVSGMTPCWEWNRSLIVRFGARGFWSKCYGRCRHWDFLCDHDKHTNREYFVATLYTKGPGYSMGFGPSKSREKQRLWSLLIVLISKNLRWLWRWSELAV